MYLPKTRARKVATAVFLTPSLIGVVVNNVNARAFMLEPRYIAKLARLADAWRPYGIRVFLSARFSAPRDIGGLATARAVVVLDENNIVRYTELVPEIAQEPDYNAALAVL